jgi:hypothetical protein
VNPFQSLREYEEFVYTLRRQFSSIRQSTLVLIPRGRRIAILQGDLYFDRGFRLSVKERLSDEAGHVTIEAYGYELWSGSEKIAWYDAQPHPNNPELQPTFPHHKHIPPDIKHHRIPAPGMGFDHPNLPLLVAEIENLLSQSAHQNSITEEK